MRQHGGIADWAPARLGWAKNSLDYLGLVELVLHCIVVGTVGAVQNLPKNSGAAHVHGIGLVVAAGQIRMDLPTMAVAV